MKVDKLETEKGQNQNVPICAREKNMKALYEMLADGYEILLKNKASIKKDLRKLEILFPKYFLTTKNIGEIFVIKDSFIDDFKIRSSVVQLIDVEYSGEDIDDPYLPDTSSVIYWFKQRYVSDPVHTVRPPFKKLSDDEIQERHKDYAEYGEERWGYHGEIQKWYDEYAETGHEAWGYDYDHYYDVHKTLPECGPEFGLSWEDMRDICMERYECKCGTEEYGLPCHICHTLELEDYFENDKKVDIKVSDDFIKFGKKKDSDFKDGFIFDTWHTRSFPVWLNKSNKVEEDFSDLGIITQNILSFLDDSFNYYEKIHQIKQNQHGLFLNEDDIGEVLLEPDYFFPNTYGIVNKFVNKFIFKGLDGSNFLFRTDHENFNEYFDKFLNLYKPYRIKKNLYSFPLKVVDKLHLKSLGLNEVYSGNNEYKNGRPECIYSESRNEHLYKKLHNFELITSYPTREEYEELGIPYPDSDDEYDDYNDYFVIYQYYDNGFDSLEEAKDNLYEYDPEKFVENPWKNFKDNVCY